MCFSFSFFVGGLQEKGGPGIVLRKTGRRLRLYRILFGNSWHFLPQEPETSKAPCNPHGLRQIEGSFAGQRLPACQNMQRRSKLAVQTKRIHFDRKTRATCVPLPQNPPTVAIRKSRSTGTFASTGLLILQGQCAIGHD